MASDQLVVAALGRPFTLGMLYDARTDTLLRGSSLWDSGRVQRMTLRRPQPYSNFTLTGSTEERASLLQVDASLRASVLCGFVKAEGSAKYLHSQRQFKNQCRVTLQYQATTHFQQLSLTSEDWDQVQDMQTIEKGLATHVVTAVEYGANAFFVFDSQQVETTEIQQFKLEIQGVVNLILYERDLNEEQKSLVKNLTVTLFSDFLLSSVPTTFQEAVQTYKDLTKLLGQNDQNAVPVRVWMMPLKYINPNSAQIIRGISVGLVIEAENTLEDLANVQMRCNDSLSNSAVRKFPLLQHQLTTFNRLCHYYTVELQRQMAEKCPAIREGKEEESALRQIFDDREESPFKQVTLSTWLDHKEREVNVIQSCLGLMKDVPVQNLLSTQSEIGKFVLSPENSSCSGYIFTSVTNTDPYIEEMSRYLDALNTGRAYEPLWKDSDVPWCYSDETVRDMRTLAEEFNEAKQSTKVFIAAIYKNPSGGASEVKYKDGVLM